MCYCNFYTKVILVLTQTQGRHVKVLWHLQNELNVWRGLNARVYGWLCGYWKVCSLKSWLKWTTPVMCLWGTMWAPLPFSSPTFPFTPSLNGGTGWSRKLAQQGKNRWPRTSSAHLLEVLPSMACVWLFNLFTNSRALRQITVCFYSLCLQLVW